MTAVFAAALLLIIPHAALPDRCDLIERNTIVCEETGRETFSQWILQGFHQRDGKHHVAAWKLCKGETIRRDWHTGEWVLVLDGKEYRATTWRLTITTFDPELVDRAEWAQEKRRLRK